MQMLGNKKFTYLSISRFFPFHLAIILQMYVSSSLAISALIL